MLAMHTSSTLTTAGVRGVEGEVRKSVEAGRGEQRFLWVRNYVCSHLATWSRTCLDAEMNTVSSQHSQECWQKLPQGGC